jgi:hypothetical protein
VAALVWMSIALRQQLRANRDTAALREVVRKIIIERPAQLAQIPNRTALRGELMRDAEGALDVLNREVRGDDALALDLANAYLAIGLAKGPYSAEGSEGDPAAAATYIQKAIDLYSNLARRRPADDAVRQGQLEALSTWLHLQYRLTAIEPGKQAGAQLESEIAAMPADVREKVQGNWYLSTAYVELGAILWNNGQLQEALDLHRKALATFEGTVPAGWAQDPEKLAQLSHLQRELAISSWMYHGPGPEPETAARQSVDVLANCSAPVCRSAARSPAARSAKSNGESGNTNRASPRCDNRSLILKPYPQRIPPTPFTSMRVGRCALILRCYSQRRGPPLRRSPWRRRISTFLQAPMRVSRRAANGPWSTA